MDNIPTGGFVTAKQVVLCVSNSSPAGDYTFVNTKLNRDNTTDGLGPSALPGNGYHSNGPFPPAGDYDGADGGDGTTSAPGGLNTPYIVHSNLAGDPHTGVTNCVTILNRTVADAAFMAKIPVADGGTCTQNCGGVNDTFAAITFMYNGTNNVVGGVTYVDTDCSIDEGALIPEQSNPPSSFFNAQFQHGSYPPTWNTVDHDPNSPTYNQPIPTSPYLCDNHNNPTRAFANYEHGVVVTFNFEPAPAPPALCTLGYPYGTLPAKTATLFNESGALSSYGRVGDEIRMWYTDEHSLTLGVNSFLVNYNNPTPDHTGTYPFETMGATASKATGNPINVGSLATTGAFAALDGSGRPLHPALFITDITGLSDNASHTSAAIRAGDWQYAGGGGIAPNAVYGSWKGALLKIDSAKSPPVKTITPGADAFKNHKVVFANAGDSAAANLGNGNNPPGSSPDLGYTAELVWNISNLMYNGNPLQSGHSYRLQFMVHDGDQNKGGGDVGEACLNIGPIGGATPPPVILINPDA
jgi:hypothetical protein